MYDSTSCILKWLTCSVSLRPTHVAPSRLNGALCLSCARTIYEVPQGRHMCSAQEMMFLRSPAE